jgi:uncharacterized protein
MREDWIMEKNYEDRKGDYIGTYLGGRLYPLDPRIEDIDEREIAHALSMICRFTGHVKFHYSVAQHSILCADLIEIRQGSINDQLYCLLHDASEAYICDVSRPVKQYMSEYKVIEGAIQDVVFKKFGLPDLDYETALRVDAADNALLNVEAVTLLRKADWADKEWAQLIESDGICINSQSPEAMEKEWLEKLYYLLAMRSMEAVQK